eukprot:1727394-Prymnesium_polylepis.1
MRPLCTAVAAWTASSPWISCMMMWPSTRATCRRASSGPCAKRCDSSRPHRPMHRTAPAAAALDPLFGSVAGPCAGSV